MILFPFSFFFYHGLFLFLFPVSVLSASHFFLALNMALFRHGAFEHSDLLCCSGFFSVTFVLSRTRSNRWSALHEHDRMRCLFCVRSHQIPLLCSSVPNFRGPRSNMTRVRRAKSCRLFPQSLRKKCFSYICITSALLWLHRSDLAA